MTQAASGSKLFTIGHSNMSFEAFASILKQFAINTVVDIRRFPSSQKFPHFNQKALQGALGELGIAYVWLEGLGGRRNHGLENSPNVGLRVKGFRNYADHMFSSAFKQAVSELLRLARESTTVIMCAERHF